MPIMEPVNTELQLRAAVCEVGRRLWQKGLIGAAEGNISVRLSPKLLLCTPKGVSKGHLRPDDLVTVDTSGRPTRGGEPSSEIKLHTHVYHRREDCQAIIHAHPPIATGLTLAGEDIRDDVLPEAGLVLGSVPTVPFAMTGTDEVPEAIEPYIEDHKAFLLSHHGAVVLGKDVYDAYNRMETLERVAHMIVTAQLLGGAKPMPSEAFDLLLENALNGRLD